MKKNKAKHSEKPHKLQKGIPIGEMALLEIQTKKEQQRNTKMRKRHIDDFQDYGSVLEKRDRSFLDEQAPSVEDIVCAIEFKQNILEAMDKLRPTLRRRVYMRFFQDMKLESIAALENTSIQAIDKSINNALKRLKKILSNNL